MMRERKNRESWKEKARTNLSKHVGKSVGVQVFEKSLFWKMVARRRRRRRRRCPKAKDDDGGIFDVVVVAFYFNDFTDKSGVVEDDEKKTSSSKKFFVKPPLPRALKGAKRSSPSRPGKAAWKSTTATNLAVAAAKLGKKVALLDADVFGPSIPLLMNQKDATMKTTTTKDGAKVMVPVENFNVKIQSMGFLLPNDQAAVWRGPMVMGALNKLIRETAWGSDLDVLFVDIWERGRAHYGGAENTDFRGCRGVYAERVESHRCQKSGGYVYKSRRENIRCRGEYELF